MLAKLAKCPLQVGQSTLIHALAAVRGLHGRTPPIGLISFESRHPGFRFRSGTQCETTLDEF